MDDGLRAYIRSIQPYGRIEPEEEFALFKIIQESTNPVEVNKALEDVVVANLRLVISRAMKFRSYYSFKILDVMDLIAEGNNAIFKSAKLFNPEHESNAKFGTYATIAIDQAIKRFIRVNHFIYVPESHLKYWGMLAELEKEHGEKLTDAIILETLDISETFLEAVRESRKSHVGYLEETFTRDDEASAWTEVIEDPNSPPVINDVDLRTYLQTHIDKLPSRQAQVVELLFLTQPPKTFSEISTEIGTTEGNVRTLAKTAMRNLKNRIIKQWDSEHGEKKDEKKSFSRYNRNAGFNIFDATPQEITQHFQEQQELRKKKDKKILSHFGCL